MQALLLLCLALLATASAFAPRASRIAVSKLSMKNDAAKFVVPAALIPFVAPMATIAAEGTGRAFGFDDGRLVLAALLPSIIIFPLYLKWSGEQEKDDFFDGYEKRRNG